MHRIFLSQLSREKKDILEILWRIGKPISLENIAQEAKLKTRSAIAHLSTLRKMGYIALTENRLYTLTDLGREVLGLPKLDRDLAGKILSEVPPEKAFYFYVEVGKPLMVSSNSLTDFCEKIQSVDVKSIEFHTSRGDFESWIYFLGDIELAKRLRLIKEMSLTGEELRRQIHETVKARCEELQRITSPIVR